MTGRASAGAAIGHAGQLRVAHVIYHLEIGGGEIFLRDLAVALRRRGLDQRVLCVGPGGPLASTLEDIGIPVEVLDKRRGFAPAAVLRLARRLRAFAPDVVQTHGEAGVFWGVPAARLAGAPAVCSLVYQNYPETWAKMTASRLLLPRAHHVIAGSESVRRFVLAHFGLKADRVETVHNGIDVAAFTTLERPRQGRTQAPRLMTVGRLVARKGHELAVRAMPAVLSAFPAAELSIIGEGPLRRPLEQLAAQLGIQDHVLFRGTIWPTTPLLREADLFLFPSVAEPQGLAVLEAFAAGVPVIAANTGGIPEMVAHEETGLLVPPGDPAALAAAAVALLSDRARGARLATQARNRVLDFDIPLVAARFEPRYRELAGR